MRHNGRILRRQSGLAAVEMTIIATIMFVLLLGLLEFSRVLWSWGTLAETTRRGARVAAICPPLGNAASVPARIAAFQDENGNGPSVLAGFAPANVSVVYQDANGANITPSCANFGDIRYVQVSVRNYSISLNIPGFDLSLTAPPFTTLLPSENLGYIPNPADPSAPGFQCFGITSAPC